MKRITILILMLILTITTACSKAPNQDHKNHAPQTPTPQNTADQGLNTRMPPTTDADLQIQIADLTENALFYPITLDGVYMEIIAVNIEGTVRTSLNTCQACYSSGKGYFVQEGTVLVCQNCKRRFRLTSLGIAADGCNPVPIAPENRTDTDTTVTISKGHIAQYKDMFLNWKQ